MSPFTYRCRIYDAINKGDGEALDALCNRLSDAEAALDLLRKNGFAETGTTLADAVKRAMPKAKYWEK